MPQTDRDYLREYVRAQPPRQEDETLTAYLRRVGVDKGEPTDKPAGDPSLADTPANRAYYRSVGQKVLAEDTERQKAAKRAQADQARQVAEAKRAAEQEAKRQQRQNAGLIEKAFRIAGFAPNKAADTVEGWQARIATIPTPGGTGAMLALLLLFIAFIVPVAANYTRAQLFWLTLLGRTSISDKGTPADTSGSAAKSGSTPTEPVTGRPGGIPVEPRALPITVPMPGSTGGPSLPIN